VADVAQHLDGPRAKTAPHLFAPQYYPSLWYADPGGALLLLPFYVMVVTVATSLKGMPEIRMGNIFAPPVEIIFQPWVEACAELNCDGLSRVFWNSVQITVPSAIVSIAIA